MSTTRLRRVLAIRRVLPGAVLAERYVHRARFIRDLQRLHDTLATTALAGRYSVCGGLLLGWARDGSVLLEDVHDADFVYLAEDAAAFESAARELVRAGFTPAVRYVNNDGQVFEHRFRRGGAQFDFFALWRRDGMVRYFMYDGSHGHELVCERPDQALVPFRFLGRSWLKPADHEAALTDNYGDWRTPQRDWRFCDAGTVIQRRPAMFMPARWDPMAN